MVMYIRSVYGGWVVVWWWWYWYGMVVVVLVWYGVRDTRRFHYTYFTACTIHIQFREQSCHHTSDLTGEFGRTLWQDRHCRIPLLDTPFGTITMAARG